MKYICYDNHNKGNTKQKKYLVMKYVRRIFKILNLKMVKKQNVIKQKALRHVYAGYMKHGIIRDVLSMKASLTDIFNFSIKMKKLKNLKANMKKLIVVF